MKLWLLRPAEDLPSGIDPWDPWYDKVFGFVIRAETEEDARRLAHDEAGNENRGKVRGPWLNARYATCVELTADGDPAVVMEDAQA